MMVGGTADEVKAVPIVGRLWAVGKAGAGMSMPRVTGSPWAWPASLGLPSCLPLEVGWEAEAEGLEVMPSESGLASL